MKHPKFLNWEESSWSSIIWLNGQMGVGKSFLTSKVIDRYRFRSINALSSTSRNDEGFAHFYCDRTITGRKDAKSILRSYIVQLLTMSRHQNKWHSQLRPFCDGSNAARRSLEFSDCERIITELIEAYPRSFLILDALDECEEEYRMTLVGFFHRLVEGASRPVKIFISSRPETDIAKLMKSTGFIQISTADNKENIEKYIDSIFSKCRPGSKWAEGRIQDRVKKVLLERNDGMLKWVELQWEQLKQRNTETAIIERLGALPRGLKDTYQEIYSQQEVYDLIILQRAVKWIKCAQEPLTTNLLLQVVQLSFSEEQNTGYKLNIDKETITESNLDIICRHLIVRDPCQEVWKFPHTSVAEFFELKQNREWIGKAEQEVASLLLLSLYAC